MRTNGLRNAFNAEDQEALRSRAAAAAAYSSHSTTYSSHEACRPPPPPAGTTWRSLCTPEAASSYPMAQYVPTPLSPGLFAAVGPAPRPLPPARPALADVSRYHAWAQNAQSAAGKKLTGFRELMGVDRRRLHPYSLRPWQQCRLGYGRSPEDRACAPPLGRFVLSPPPAALV